MAYSQTSSSARYTQRAPGKRSQPSHPPAASGTRSPVGASLLLLLLLSAAPALPAPAPEAVLTELRAADEARSQRLREHQEWALDKQRLELLRETLARETQRRQQTAAALNQKADLLENDLARHQEQLNRTVALALACEHLADQVDDQLDTLARRAPPGLVPPPQPPDTPKPEARLRAALRRLEETERQTTTAAVEWVSAPLAGRTETVRLLRIGGVSACWLSLDGTRSGPATWTQGTLQLEPGTAADHPAIARAVAILEQRAAPAWTVLPISR